MSRFAAFVVIAVSVVGVPVGAASSEDAEESEPRAEPRYAAPDEPEEETGGADPVPIYVPPQIGVPGGRVGGGTRGSEDHPEVRLLAPDHVGLTTRGQPTLYWYADGPIETRVDVTLRDEESVAPLLDVQLPVPIEPGVHAVSLEEHGVTLRPGASYQWFVSIVPEPDRRSKDLSAGAWIRRAEPSTPLERRLELSGVDQAVFVYAESGIWYDAIEAVSARIARSPADPQARIWRAALLEQVGLSEAAEADRSPPR